MSDDLDKYPNVAGHRGVETSIAAADEITPHIGKLQKLTFDTILQNGPDGRTGDEVAVQNGYPPHELRARISELRRKGLIADSGQRRRLRSGKRGIVWVAKQHLRAVEAASFPERAA
jgi:hypothetical protein